jgi:hypothetical protein
MARTTSGIRIRRLSDEEVRHGLQVLEQARALRAAVVASRGGRELPESWPVIRRQRETRSRQI